MKHSMISLALVAALAGAATAQTEDDYDAFGTVDDNIPLDQLVPETDDLPAPQPYVSDNDPALVEPVVETAAQPTTPPTPQIAQFDAPADWVSHDINGFQFSAPGDWPVVKENRSSIMLFGGDMDTRTGPMFGIMFDKDGLPDADEAEILSQSDVQLADGTPFSRVELQATLGDDGGIAIQTLTYLSKDKNEDGKYTILMLAAYNEPLTGHRDVLDKILGTVVAPEAVSYERPVALNGMISYELAKDWRVSNAADDAQISMRSQFYSGYIEIATDHWVTGEQGLDDSVPANASVAEPAEIFGHKAMLRSWTGTNSEFFIGASMVVGKYDYYRLNQCLPGGAPIGILLVGGENFKESKEFTTALASIEMTLPDGLEDCAALNAPAPSMPVTPWKSERSEDAETTPVVTPPAPVAPTIVVGKIIDIEGVRFNLPDGWEAVYDSPSDKSFSSPDGRFSILAFWWFPDEPLTGYDDDVSVNHLIIDHEPVMRIVSRTGPLLLIQHVTERARADEKRFIFTVESKVASLEELTALQDSLIVNLHLGSGFDPALRDVVNVAPQVPEIVPATPTDLEGFADSETRNQQAGSTDLAWTRYENSRFGTMVNYPSNLFRATQAPANNDGRTFEGIDGTHSFFVFGQHNIDALSIRDLMARDISWGGYDQVTYEKAGNGWYVLSGYKGRDIFYRKVLVDQQNEVLHVLEITYPAALKQEFDAVVTDMAASLAMATEGPSEGTEERVIPSVDLNAQPRTSRRNQDEYDNNKR